MALAGDISSSDIVIAIATREAVEAAGGAQIVMRETNMTKTPLYNCMSEQHADSVSVRNAVLIDRLSGGRAAILRAQARILGYALVKIPDAPEDELGIIESVCKMSADLGDVSRATSEGLACRKYSPGEALRTVEKIDVLQESAASLRVKLMRIVEDGRG